MQVNGKVRAKINIPKDLSKEDMQELALQNENVKLSIEGKEIKKLSLYLKISEYRCKIMEEEF